MINLLGIINNPTTQKAFYENPVFIASVIAFLGLF